MGGDENLMLDRNSEALVTYFGDSKFLPHPTGAFSLEVVIIMSFM